MRKILSIVIGVALFQAAYAGDIYEASKILNNCEMVAGMIAQELGLSGDSLTKDKAVSRIKLSIDNSDVLADKYYRIAADEVYAALRGLDQFIDDEWGQQKARGITNAGVMCKVEYLQEAASKY